MIFDKTNGNADPAKSTRPFKTVGRYCVYMPYKNTTAPPSRNSANAALAAFLAFTNVFCFGVISDMEYD